MYDSINWDYLYYMIGSLGFCENVYLEVVSQFLSCNIGSIPFKFLGIPTGANQRICSTWKAVVDGMKAKFLKWKGRKLSIGQERLF